MQEWRHAVEQAAAWRRMLGCHRARTAQRSLAAAFAGWAASAGVGAAEAVAAAAVLEQHARRARRLLLAARMSAWRMVSAPVGTHDSGPCFTLSDQY